MRNALDLQERKKHLLTAAEASSIQRIKEKENEMRRKEAEVRLFHVTISRKVDEARRRVDSIVVDKEFRKPIDTPFICIGRCTCAKTG